MKENTLYDKKSLKTVVGKTADFAELAKDCVAFSNAQGGVIDIGIEDKDTLPPASQRIPNGQSVFRKCI
jgi:ATP-dependent DNA helicase RecG